MATHAVALHLVAENERCEQALEDLRAELGEDAVEEPDELTGLFSVEVEAETLDEALLEVQNAIAAIGADDCFELGEPGGPLPGA
jgi:hypothetical protein